MDNTNVYELLANLSLHIRTQASIQKEIVERGMDWYLKSRNYKSPEHFMSVCAVASDQNSKAIEKFLRKKGITYAFDHEGNCYLNSNERD